MELVLFALIGLLACGLIGLLWSVATQSNDGNRRPCDLHCPRRAGYVRHDEHGNRVGE